MQYRTDLKTGNKLSILGFGCMRFPRNLTQIDFNRTEQLILRAVEKGVNYFDTAYLYGGSEEVLGKIIAKNNLRGKVFLATKLPLIKCKTYDDFEKVFTEQLKSLNTDYIDYYLMHNLPNAELWKKFCDMGIEKWLREKKEKGQIKNIGFSFHGMYNEFNRLLDAYNWDLLLMQYNYLDENFQAGRAGLREAAARSIPVIIMEPLLGGKLANGMPKKAVNIFKTADSSLTPAAWALRWLWNQKEVTVVLSGMNDISQLEENLKTAENSLPDMLTEGENNTYKSVIDLIRTSYKIPCTGCNYCMPCPHRVNIPACFSAYNVSYTIGLYAGIKNYITSTEIMHSSKNYSAYNCTECGNCEKLCPQHIPIIKSLRDARKRVEPFWLKAGLNLYRKAGEKK
ncbi:MAG: aldo/keto reductase [Treponema sp.]|nr:aldo/keto reductase [Treponema sp.]